MRGRHASNVFQTHYRPLTVELAPLDRCAIVRHSVVSDCLCSLVGSDKTDYRDDNTELKPSWPPFGPNAIYVTKCKTKRNLESTRGGNRPNLISPLANERSIKLDR